MRSKLHIPEEGKALLNLVRASLVQRPPVSNDIPDTLDWVYFQRLARHHRLEPLLAYAIRYFPSDSIPPSLREEWEACRRREVALALLNKAALGAIAGAFEDHGIPFILLKGEALSSVLYPEEGLRPYRDIDLLLKSEAYETAKAILMDLGFRLQQPEKESEKRRLFGAIEFVKEGPITVTVDLHWDTLMASWEPPSLFSERGTWAAVDRVRIGNRALAVLYGEVLVLHLCVHIAFHHVFTRLLLFCDLFLVLRRDAERIDWDSLVATANRCQCRHALYYSLLFVNTLMAASVPSEILAQLRPPTFLRALMPTDRLLFRDRLVPLMLERYVKFLLIDTQEGRWRAAQAFLRSSKRIFGRQPVTADQESASAQSGR